MEQVVREYGHFMIELLAILFALGMVLGALELKAKESLHTSDVNYQEYTDFNRFKEEAQKEKPQIYYNNAGSMTCGVHKLTDYIKATDYTGNEIPIKVISILTPQGTELISEYDETREEMKLARTGIYVVEVQAVDREKRRCLAKIKIPVGED